MRSPHGCLAFALTHPLQPEDTVQGNLYLMYALQEWLMEISGFAGITYNLLQVRKAN
jgi:glycine cleavage system protein P-like pyridoxal-binding family